MLPVESLRQLISHLRGQEPLAPSPPMQPTAPARSPDSTIDLAHIRGQEHAKRAVEVAKENGDGQ